MRATALVCIALVLSLAAQAADPVEQARRDLAGRLDVAVDAVEFVSLSEVQWPDSSLGCPQPGMGYRQVITDGQRLLLRAEGALFSYHAGRDGVFFYCAKPAAREPPTPRHLTLSTAIEAAHRRSA